MEDDLQGLPITEQFMADMYAVMLSLDGLSAAPTDAERFECLIRLLGKLAAQTSEAIGSLEMELRAAELPRQLGQQPSTHPARQPGRSVPA